jgi:hypothetical protein
MRAPMRKSTSADHARCPDAVRGPPITSVRRFQLGESGDGEQLLRKAALAGDQDHLIAAKLFVAEEQQHAACRCASAVVSLDHARCSTRWATGAAGSSVTC